MSEPVQPEVVQQDPEAAARAAQAAGEEGEQIVAQPAKLIRIASMMRELVEEVRQIKLDQEGIERIRGIYNRSVSELKGALNDALQRELEELATPLASAKSEAEVRVAQAQLLGWLEGLFHGIQAALWAQHVQAQAALEEMRRRGLPAGPMGPPGGPMGGPQGQEERPKGPPGQYL